MSTPVRKCRSSAQARFSSSCCTDTAVCAVTQQCLQRDRVAAGRDDLHCGVMLRDRIANSPRCTRCAVEEHRLVRGQLVGTLSRLVTIGLDDQEWVVPAIHAIWIPPHWRHSLRTFGPILGWSAFVAEARCAALPTTPRAICCSDSPLRQRSHINAFWLSV
ncbi:hypothetical protein WL57_00165 [Burkholderia cepacia]|nr:hypothetical protein WL57_00165 [Burkholderia cepacia]